jgi:hypothetical protein
VLVPLFVTELLMFPWSDKVWLISARNTVDNTYGQQEIFEISRSNYAEYQDVCVLGC